MPLAAVLSLIVVGILLWLFNGYIPIPGRGKNVINVVLGLIAVGIFLWLVNTYVPMAGVIKAILNIVVVVATCVGVLQALGLWDSVVRGWRNMTHRALEHSEHAADAHNEEQARKEAEAQKEIARKEAEAQQEVVEARKETAEAYKKAADAHKDQVDQSAETPVGPR